MAGVYFTVGYLGLWTKFWCFSPLCPESSQL